MTDRQYSSEQPADDFDQDLHPNSGAGQNRGIEDEIGTTAPTAYDIKAVHDLLDNLTDDNLKSIPIVPTGTRLAQGAVYIDLHDPNRQEFKARGDMEAGSDNWYVPKSEVDYQLWNELIGVNTAARLGEADET